VFKITFLHKAHDVDYFFDYHLGMALQFPGAIKLTSARIQQNPLTKQLPFTENPDADKAPEWNLLNELYFPDEATYLSAYASDAAKKAYSDITPWTDLSKTIIVTSEEEEFRRTV
jgi:hypothetical protein